MGRTEMKGQIIDVSWVALTAVFLYLQVPWYDALFWPFIVAVCVATSFAYRATETPVRGEIGYDGGSLLLDMFGIEAFDTNNKNDKVRANIFKDGAISIWWKDKPIPCPFKLHDIFATCKTTMPNIEAKDVYDQLGKMGTIVTEYTFEEGLQPPPSPAADHLPPVFDNPPSDLEQAEDMLG